MGDPPPALDDTNIQWTKATSKHGKPFEIGVKRIVSEDETKGKTESLDSLTPFDIGVNWQVDTAGATTSDVQSTAAITEYALAEPGGVYSYELSFTNTAHYDYTFYDETDDGYECNTYVDGNHSVRYNSSGPNIVRITGS